MKIVFATGIYPPELGGPAGFVRNMCAELVKRGDVPHVVTYGDAYTQREDAWSVQVVDRRGGVLVRYARYAWHVYQAARRADVVFAQGPVSEGLPSLIAAFFARKPFMLKVVGDYAWEQYSQRVPHPELMDMFLTRRHTGSIGRMERIERFVARHATRVITPSAYLKTVVERWGVASARISVIYNAISPMPAGASRAEVRAREGIPMDARLVMTAMRAVPWKRIDWILEVLSSLPDNVRFVFVGDGPSLDAWKERAHALHLDARVMWPGAQSRAAVADWLRAADVFISPSSYEGFPNNVVEAVSLGLPCVVSDACGNPETRDLFPKSVTVVPMEDTSAWASAITHATSYGETVDLSSQFRDMVDAYQHEFKNVCASS